MFETLDKLMLAGLGAMSMTKEKAEQIFDEYVKKGEAQREHRAGFVKEVMEHADKAKKDLEKVISEQLEKAMSKQPLATKEDIKRIESKLDQLLAK
ncbi:MAG: phasin family protein [Planctomycetales bacterium]|nr:phasin family protein [Planctomycetales bacterium]